MRLDNDRKLLENVVVQTGDYFGIMYAAVEKDYYLTLFLKELSARIPDLLFKGGTCLSKCFRVVRRFSEDIDVTLDREKATCGQRHNLKYTLIDVCSDLGLTLTNEADTRSRRDFNRYIIDYRPGQTPVAIEPYLFVETTFIGRSYPVGEGTAASMIHDYADAVGAEDFIRLYELEPFPVKVQTLDRTLIDKVFALCDYHLKGMTTRNSRHLYDIYRIADRVALDDGFAELIRQVREDRKLRVTRCVSAADEYSVTALMEEMLEMRTFEEDYKVVSSKLLYEDVPYDEATGGLRKLIDSGIFG